MLTSISRIKNMKMHASDGEIGHVQEFYLDDERWTVRYLIVNTGGWLARKSVLISPIFLRGVDWQTGELYTTLTKAQIESSPDIDTQQPVSRQHEAVYLNTFNSPYYWGGPYLWGRGPLPSSPAMLDGSTLNQPIVADRESANSHLRSTEALTGYRIMATNGEIGHLHDFVLDTDTWGVRYIEVSTRNWWPGKKVLIAPEWINFVSWMTTEFAVGLSREDIKSAPEYVESREISRIYEEQLHVHYGQPPIWVDQAKHAQPVG